MKNPSHPFFAILCTGFTVAFLISIERQTTTLGIWWTFILAMAFGVMAAINIGSWAVDAD